jgi:hypothetical protein
LSYFKGGIRILEGGIASAFNHVDPAAYTPRLLHLKGKRNVRVSQVELKTSSLNEGDVFILDAGLTLFQWNGRGANRQEKFKGLEMITAIKDKERGGKAKTIFIESGTPAEGEELFWTTLGGKTGIQDEKSGGSDDDVKAAVNELFRISDSTGELKVTSVGRGRLEKKLLDTTDVFLLDAGTQVFVWVGKGATKEERAKSMPLASSYLASKGRPSHTPITRIIETGETPVFKSYFVDFVDKHPSLEEKKAAPVAKKAADTSALYREGKEEEEKPIDSGDGKLEIWRVENFDKVPVEKANYGQFFSGDSYVMLYTYLVAGKERWIIYFWQGRDSTTDEKGASALLAVDLDNKYGGAPVQVRVVQNKEPNHFLTLFKGKMVIHDGGKASGFKNRADIDTKAPANALYHVKGTNALNTRAVQVPADSANLNSGDVFILLTATIAYVWQGTGSNAEEQKTATGIATLLKGSRTVTPVTEGKEPEAFWTAIGGKKPYATAREAGGAGRAAPRLFHCSTNGGHFYVQEVFNFSQDDLIDDDVMILDTFAEVFVWVGSRSSEEEKKGSLKAALDYVANAPDGRSADTPIYRVTPGNEPPNFTAHFLGWNPAKASDFSDPYVRRLAELRSGPGAGAAPAKGGVAAKTETKAAAPATAAPAKGAGAGAAPERVTAASTQYLDWATNAFPIDRIKAGVPNTDPSNKHLYLSDTDFAAQFKMNKADFQKQPQWKRDAERKRVGLF